MEKLFTGPTFAGFGPNSLNPFAGLSALYQVRARGASGLRLRVRQECPRRPGVYGMVNVHGELFYVGKAKCLRSRLLSYFRSRSRDPKAGRIVEHTRVLAWEPAPSEFAALLRELELIRRWRPRYNVQGQPRRRRLTFVCLGRRPAPYAFLTSRPTAGALACFGPIPASLLAREAVRRVNDWFGLRDCPQHQEMIFADQGELFPVVRAAACLRHEIGTCLGPCAGACTQAAYAERVRAARTFLAGTDRTPLEVLERDMTAAALAQEFERAVVLRDKLAALRWLDDRLERLRQAREQHTFVYPVRGHAGQDLWYLIHRGRVAATTLLPHDAASKQKAADTLEAIYGNPNLGIGALTADNLDAVLLVAAWFRKHPEERSRILQPAEAKTACGGEIKEC